MFNSEKNLKEKQQNISEDLNIPLKVDITDIQSNGKLLSDEKIKAVRKIFIKKTKKNNNSDFQYISKKKLSSFLKNIEFSCVQAGGQLFAIYHGKRKGKELAEGGYGVTKYAQNLDTGEWCVIKVLQKRAAATQMEKQDREIAISKEVNLAIAAGSTSSKKKGDRVKILMRLVPGTEYAKLRSNTEEFKKLSLNDRFKVAINLLNQLENLHKNHIAHLDVLVGNILMDNDMNVELIDFGKAQKYNSKNDKEYSFDQFEIDKKIDVRDAYMIIIDLLGMETSYSTSREKEFIKNNIANFPNDETKNIMAENLLTIGKSIGDLRGTVTVSEMRHLLEELQNKLVIEKDFYNPESSSRMFKTTLEIFHEQKRDNIPQKSEETSFQPISIEPTIKKTIKKSKIKVITPLSSSQSPSISRGQTPVKRKQATTKTTTTTTTTTTPISSLQSSSISRSSRSQTPVKREQNKQENLIKQLTTLHATLHEKCMLFIKNNPNETSVVPYISQLNDCLEVANTVEKDQDRLEEIKQQMQNINIQLNHIMDSIHYVDPNRNNQTFKNRETFIENENKNIGKEKKSPKI